MSDSRNMVSTTTGGNGEEKTTSMLVLSIFVLRAGQFDSSIRAFYTSLIQDAIPDSERETQLHCLDYLSLYLNT